MKIERRPLASAGQALYCTRAMAKVMSVDLSEVLHLGGLNTADYAARITRCRGCADSRACAEWLEAQELGAKNLPIPPQNCENRDVLLRFARVFS